MSDIPFKKIDGETVLGEFKNIRVQDSTSGIGSGSRVREDNILVTNKRILLSVQKHISPILSKAADLNGYKEIYDTCQTIIYLNKIEAENNFRKLSFSQKLGNEPAKYIGIKNIEISDSNLVIKTLGWGYTWFGGGRFTIFGIGNEIQKLIKDIPLNSKTIPKIAGKKMLVKKIIGWVLILLGVVSAFLTAYVIYLAVINYYAVSAMGIFFIIPIILIILGVILLRF